MKNVTLIKKYHNDVGGLSVFGSYYRSKRFKKITHQGLFIIPDILLYLREHGSMAIIWLLIVICKEQSIKGAEYRPKRLEGSPLASWNVKEAVISWVDWGIENKYITN